MKFQSIQRLIIVQYKILVLGLAIVLGSFTTGGVDNEYQVKAMFIYNFTKYIEWPQNQPDNVFRIGVVGKSDIIESLKAIAGQKKVGEKKIEVNSITPDESEHTYQIIFISQTQSKEIEKIGKANNGKGVLIIAEESDKFDKGAAINLVTQDKKIRFEINQTQAKNGGIKISSQLLPLALSVHQ